MTHAFDRVARVSREVYEIVVLTCTQTLRDPRLEGVNITRVEMTRDLKIARVFFVMLAGYEANRDAAQSGLTSASGFLKREIGRHLSLKFMPEIQVFYDENLDVDLVLEKK